MAAKHFAGLIIIAATIMPAQLGFGVEVGVDPAATWLGFMNVSELPENGGAYVFGSGWGTADLVATFSGSNLTLAPNSVNDPNEFWYVGGGGPGAPGNKWMEANFYVEDSTTLVGTTVTFSGVVASNTLVDPYSAIAFIKDFSPNYSSFVIESVPLTPGPFSITLETIDEPGRHIQYGFATTGPNVWITDAPAKGSVQIVAPNPADFNRDGAVDGLDLTAWKGAFGLNANADADRDGDTDGNDFLIWQRNRTAPAGVSAVPEPAGLALLAAGTIALAAARRRRR